MLKNGLLLTIAASSLLFSSCTKTVVEMVKVPIETIKYVEKTVYVDKEVEVPVEVIKYVDREVEVPVVVDFTSDWYVMLCESGQKNLYIEGCLFEYLLVTTCIFDSVKYTYPVLNFSVFTDMHCVQVCKFDGVPLQCYDKQQWEDPFRYNSDIPVGLSVLHNAEVKRVIQSQNETNIVLCYEDCITLYDLITMREK